MRSGTCPAPAIEIPITGSSDYCGLTDFSRDDNEYYMERERFRRELDIGKRPAPPQRVHSKCQQIGQQRKAAEPTTNEHEKNQKRDAEAEEARKKSGKSRQDEAAMLALKPTGSVASEWNNLAKRKWPRFV